MFRFVVLWTSLIYLFFFGFGGCSPPVSPSDAGSKESLPEPTPPHPGQALYQKYCALCHGQAGEGYESDAANALNNPNFLAIASDTFLKEAIEKGHPNTAMPAWGKAYTGPLSTKEIQEIIGYIRLWQKGKSISLPPKNHSGNKERGKQLFAANCANCHGDKGQGRSNALSLNNPIFLNSASDAYIRYTIQKGRPEQPMPEYEKQLKPQEIEDILALIRSWQQKPPSPPKALPPMVFTPLLPYPKGKPATFTEKGQFIGAKEVASALKNQEAFVLLDARLPLAYHTKHIQGALSTPFYAPGKVISSLSKTQWILIYCDSPVAQAEALYSILQQEGFAKLKILREGFAHWKQQGYPIRTGSDP